MTSLADLVGKELGPSSWLVLTQERIDAFAEATEDRQWIHTDAARAADGPFGTTIAHGYLTLSLCVPMLYELLPRSGRMAINYGVDRVRFPAPVPSGARIRARMTVSSIEETPTGQRGTIHVVVECDGSEKPACVADLVVLTVS